MIARSLELPKDWGEMRPSGVRQGGAFQTSELFCPEYLGKTNGFKHWQGGEGGEHGMI